MPSRHGLYVYTLHTQINDCPRHYELGILGNVGVNGMVASLISGNLHSPLWHSDAVLGRGDHLINTDQTPAACSEGSEIDTEGSAHYKVA